MRAMTLWLAAATAGTFLLWKVSGPHDAPPAENSVPPPAEAPGPAVPAMARRTPLPATAALPPPAVTNAPVAGETALPDAEAELIALENECDRLTEENGKLKDQVQSLLAWILSSFKGHTPVPDKLMARLDLRFVDESDALHADVIDFLNINPDEKARIEQAMRNAREMVRYVEQQVMQVEMASDTEALIRIPSYAEQGAQIQDILYKEVDSVIGPERFDQFLDTAEKNLLERFGQFGRTDRLLHFQVASLPDRNEPVLKIRDETATVDEQGRRITHTVEQYADSLPADYLLYLQGLPPPAEKEPNQP